MRDSKPWEQREQALIQPKGVGHPALTHIPLRHGVVATLGDIPSTRSELFAHVEKEDVFALGYHLKGGASFDYGRGAFVTRKADHIGALIPGGAQSLFGIPANGLKSLSIRFPPEVARDLFAHSRMFSLHTSLARRDADEVEFVRFGAMDTRLAAEISAMFACGYTGAARSLFLESAVLSILARELAQDDEVSSRGISSADRRRLVQARDILEAQLDDPPTILALARECGLNDFKLKRDFKRLFGVTIFGYIRERRLSRAALLIRDGYPVHIAALEVGYSCPGRFAQAFRQRFGVPPRAYKTTGH